MAFSILPHIWYYQRDVEIHVPIQDISLTGLNTPDVHLGNLKGKVLVLDFWNTVCGYCYQSKPKIQALAKKYKDNPDVLIASVASAYYDSLSGVQQSEYLRIGAPHVMPEFFDHTGELARRLAPEGCPIVTFVRQDGIAILNHDAYDVETRRLYGHLLDLQIQEMLSTQQ